MTRTEATRAARVAVTVHYFPPHVGGMELVARQQAESLAARGHDVTVLTCSHASGMPRQERAGAGYRIDRTAALNLFEHRFGVTFPIVSPRFLPRTLRASADADVVHVHDVFYPTSHATALGARLLGRPLFVTQHVGIVEYPSRLVTGVQRAIYRLVGRPIFAAAERIVVYNTNVRDFLLDLGVEPGKILLQHNGIDTGRFRPVEPEDRDVLRTRYDLPLDRPVILFVGRLVPKKGFQFVHGARSPAHFTLIVGNGAIPAGMGDDEDVRFFGPADDDQVRDLYAACDLFVFPAVGEIFTLVMQEAMASGLPVILYDDPGYAGYDLDRTRVRFVERTQDAVSAAIVALLADPGDRAIMGEYSRALALERFSWERNYDAEVALYDPYLRSCDRTPVAVVATYFPPHLGGVEQVAETLAIGTAARRDVTVLTAKATGCSPREDDHPPRLRIRRLWALAVANVPLIPGLPIELLRLRAGTIVHVHLCQAFTPEVAWLISRGRRLPLVVHFHLDIEPSGRFGPIFELYKRFVLPRVLRGADLVITLTDEQTAFVTRHYGVDASRVAVLPNGVDPAFFAADDHQPHHGPCRLLFVGRLSPQKNVPRLLRAIASVRGDVELVIVGDGESRGAVEDLVEDLGLTNVRLVGAARGAELVEWYRWADAFVITSDREGMPLVVLEAMAAGLPVVATDVPGLRGTVGDDGLLVPPDPTELAAAIDRLLAEPERMADLAARSRRRAPGHSWDRIVAELDALYEGLAT